MPGSCAEPLPPSAGTASRPRRPPEGICYHRPPGPTVGERPSRDRRSSTRARALALLSIVLGLDAARADDVEYLPAGDASAARIIDALTPIRHRGILPVPDPAGCRLIRTRGITLADPPPAQVDLEIRFAFDSADLTPNAEEVLDELAEALQSKELEPCCFQVEGHTDSVGDARYNQTLSERRARSVARYLAGKGIHVDRMLTVGAGEESPRADNASAAGRARNRRVRLLNLGFPPATPPGG